jgi:hypothetical protein
VITAFLVNGFGVFLIIMKVSRTRSTATPATRKKGKASAASSQQFAEHLTGVNKAVDTPKIVGETSAPGPIGSILAAQEVSNHSDQEARRNLQRRGEDILDKLEEIRRDMIDGAIPVERLTNLAQLLKSKRQTVDDENLLKLIDEIELRAEGEIAKLSRHL